MEGTAEDRHRAASDATENAGDRIRPEDWSAIVAGLREEFDRSVLALRRAVVLEKARLEVGLVEGLFSLALGFVAALIGVVVAILGTVFFFLGIRAGLLALTGGAWWVDLVLGAVLLGGIVGGIIALRKRRASKTLHRTREKLAGMTAHERSNGSPVKAAGPIGGVN